MASIWGNNGKCDRLYIFGLQSHCWWWWQLWNWKVLAPWKKSSDQPIDHIKSRCSTLPTKVHLVRAMVFPVVVYGCESWNIKKAECWRIDAFELWCWRRLLRFPWTARRSNQSILKEISPEYSLEGLMLKLKLQYFGHLMRRIDSFGKTLMLGKFVGGRRRGRQRWDSWMASWTPWTWVWSSSRSYWRTGKPGLLQSVGLQRFRHNWATELNWLIYIMTQCVLSHFSHVWLRVTLWTVACHAPLSMGFSSKCTGVGFHFLLQGISLTQRLNQHLWCLQQWQVDSLPLVPSGKPIIGQKHYLLLKQEKEIISIQWGWETV